MSHPYIERDFIRRRVMLEFSLFLMLNALDFVTTLPLIDFELNPLARALFMLPPPLVAGVKMILFPFLCLLLIKFLEFKGRYKEALLSLRALLIFYSVIVLLNTIQLALSLSRLPAF
ncbi:MAG: hypothetical protein DRN78_03465 [Thermoproteota archaeon]|nr:MAG: hypothetical protein DRN78_03465 [Candidatus Korarchaeota archaeon]